VVNEAFDANGNLHHSIWYNQPGIGLATKGTAYIERAFRWAHAADPNALLFYNDYAAETINRKSDAIYAMAKDFKSRGVPIDGIGLQMHISKLDEELSSLSFNMARITALGLQVQITEMDVALPVDARGRPLHRSDLKRQAAIYGEVLAACLANSGCTAFQTWDFTDKHSWIPSFSHGATGAALLFDRHYRPKPAFRAVAAALKQADTRSSDRDRQAIVTLENEWLHATDAATLDHMLAPDFVHPVDAGVFLTKDEHIRWFVAHPPPPGRRLHFDKLRIRLYGDTAIANGTVIAADTQGKESNRTIFTDVFVRRDGRWQAVNAQENAVGARP
ncbi:MAG: endo-1,4-beta-xylanase, partial [Bryobacteraceae bacterium]